MAATLGAVAKHAGVALSTASRAFNEPGRLTPETVRRVRDSAEELGYQPNKAARALATGKTGNVALVVPDVSNPVFSAFVKSAQAQGWHQEQAVVLADTDESPERERRIVARLLPQVDGLVLCSPRLDPAELVDIAATTPLVLVNRELEGTPAVLVDVSTGMRQAVEHLAALGHRHLAYVQGHPLSWSNAERVRLLTEYTQRLGLGLDVLSPQSPSSEGGAAAAAGVLASRATAVVTYNDLVALGVMTRASAMGAVIPGDLSVVGIDDIAMAAMAHPPCTTIAVPMSTAGAASIDMLQVLINGRKPERPVTRLDTQLIVRESTAVIRETMP
jgi:LacI family transcriptional regulator